MTEVKPVRDSGGRTAERPGLKLLAQRFHRTIEGIREVLAVAAPHLEPELSPALKQLLERMTTDQGKAAMLPVLLMRYGSRPDEPPRDTEDEEAINREIEARDWDALYARAEASQLTQEDVQRVGDPLFQSKDDRYLLASFARAWQDQSLTPDKVELLNSSMLVIGVAAFENLLAGIYAQDLTFYPAAASGDTVLTLKELLQYKSIEEAQAAAVDTRVDAFMRESFDKWSTWGKNRIKCDIYELSTDADLFMEAFYRRNSSMSTTTGGYRASTSPIPERSPMATRRLAKSCQFRPNTCRERSTNSPLWESRSPALHGRDGSKTSQQSRIANCSGRRMSYSKSGATERASASASLRWPISTAGPRGMPKRCA